MDRTPYKQVIVMRKDLNMRKGKLVAQGSHASLGAVLQELNDGESLLTHPPVFNENNEFTMTLKKDTPLAHWLLSAFKKVCLYVNSEEELLSLYKNSKQAGLPVTLITDNGWTEFKGIPTNTCLAIGPAHQDDIDKITGHLPLL